MSKHKCGIAFVSGMISGGIITTLVFIAADEVSSYYRYKTLRRINEEHP